MLVGAYWSVREESREAAAARIADFLAALSAYHEDFAAWYGKGKSKSATAQSRLALDAPSIAKKLKVNYTDVGRQPIPDLGFSLWVWNDKGAWLSIDIGCWCERVTNSVVLDVSKDDGRSPDWYRPILEEMIRVFDPDHAIISSDEIRERLGEKRIWELGWFTYERGAGIQHHSRP